MAAQRKSAKKAAAAPVVVMTPEEAELHRHQQRSKSPKLTSVQRAAVERDRREKRAQAQRKPGKPAAPAPPPRVLTPEELEIERAKRVAAKRAACFAHQPPKAQRGVPLANPSQHADLTSEFTNQ